MEENKEYKILKDRSNTVTPYAVFHFIEGSNFWQQVSKSYITYNAAKRWALKHNIKI